MKKEGQMSIIVSLTVLSLLAQPCTQSSNESEMERPLVSYFEEVIPPCLPIDGSDTDPCPTGTPSNLATLSVNAAFPYWPHSDYMWTMTDIFLGDILDFPGDYFPENAPHIVIRGIAEYDTTRCGLYPIKLSDYRTIGAYSNIVHHYYCFIDIAVKEYIIGKGPSKLTVKFHTEIIWIIDEEDREYYTEERISDLFQDPQSRTASVYEGRELILLLRPTHSVSIESWAPSGLGIWYVWYVPKGEDHDIRAVSNVYGRALKEIHRNLLNFPLEEFVRLIKQAHQNKITRTGGRIGEDPNLPMLVTDANYLQDYYIAGGAVYEGDEATRLPPPVPGAWLPGSRGLRSDVRYDWRR